MSVKLSDVIDNRIIYFDSAKSQFLKKCYDTLDTYWTARKNRLLECLYECINIFDKIIDNFEKSKCKKFSVKYKDYKKEYNTKDFYDSMYEKILLGNMNHKFIVIEKFILENDWQFLEYDVNANDICNNIDESYMKLYPYFNKFDTFDMFTGDFDKLIKLTYKNYEHEIKNINSLFHGCRLFFDITYTNNQICVSVDLMMDNNYV